MWTTSPLPERSPRHWGSTASGLQLRITPSTPVRRTPPAAKNLPPAKEFAPNDDFTVIPLPGHTPGGSGLLFPTGNALFIGDTLFAGSVGRTDLPGGDYHSLMESIHSRLLTLPDDLNVYPGHGPATTIGRERAANPYLQD